MTQKGWFIQLLGEEIGPLSKADFVERARKGQIEPDTLVRPPSREKWVRADRIKGLFVEEDQSTHVGDSSEEVTDSSTSSDVESKDEEPVAELQESPATSVRSKMPLAGSLAVVGLVICAAIALGLSQRGDNQESNDVPPVDPQAQFDGLVERIRTDRAVRNELIKGHFYPFFRPDLKFTITPIDSPFYSLQATNDDDGLSGGVYQYNIALVDFNVLSSQESQIKYRFEYTHEKGYFISKCRNYLATLRHNSSEWVPYKLQELEKTDDSCEASGAPKKLLETDSIQFTGWSEVLGQIQNNGLSQLERDQSEGP